MAIFATIIVLLVAGFLVFKATHSQPQVETTSPTEWHVQAKRPLSTSEQDLYHRLIESLPGHLIFAKVSLGGFLSAKPGHDAEQWQKHIDPLRVDFLVCDQTLQIVAAVELGDLTDTKQQQADHSKTQALQAAGIKLIRWNAQSLPELNDIAAALI
ncbi:PDDEXK family nuclease [Chitinimonas naiadis]